ncbi:aminofutalosine synthase MqnE [Micromonospora sp. HM5-17]|jgi:aminodeoxyfutalosine synthase|uniref:aminofutalosine synthase MqnE n=1 Tax=Micromonospora sp. HM5-17 TaxID=2487710 RepID=UPI000F474B1B|nr:aminofutalosine synthase MqnE [Micromonospora sp. HM5-17]ROT33901.1 aminofutalosine synthase MqnE [Micromonospora sp. HM5-17]
MDAGRKRELEQKVYGGERLSRADGEALYASDDLVWLGRLAHHRRTEAHGDRVTFEVGGGEPLSSGHDYPELLRHLAATPGGVPDVVTATDIRRFEAATGRPAEELLDELAAAGLASLAGGDAGIFDPEVRSRAAGTPIDWADWARIHRLAHARGLRTSATMRYGQGEESRHRIDHLLRLRELQDETGGFQVFVPIRHEHPATGPGGAGGTGAGNPPRAASPAESLKTVAISRLLLDNVPHLRCSWATDGLPVAQLALSFGVDDLAGSPADRMDSLADVADSQSTAPSRDELLNLIWDAGFRPVERDARYAVLREYDAPVPLAQRRAEPQHIWS